jgi:hypothetical protein
LGGFIAQSGRQVVNSDPDQAFIDQQNIDSLKEKQEARLPMPINFEVALLSTPEKDVASQFYDKVLPYGELVSYTHKILTK